MKRVIYITISVLLVLGFGFYGLYRFSNPDWDYGFEVEDYNYLDEFLYHYDEDSLYLRGTLWMKFASYGSNNFHLYPLNSDLDIQLPLVKKEFVEVKVGELNGDSYPLFLSLEFRQEEKNVFDELLCSYIGGDFCNRDLKLNSWRVYENVFPFPELSEGESKILLSEENLRYLLYDNSSNVRERVFSGSKLSLELELCNFDKDIFESDKFLFSNLLLARYLESGSDEILKADIKEYFANVSDLGEIDWGDLVYGYVFYEDLMAILQSESLSEGFAELGVEFEKLSTEKYHNYELEKVEERLLFCQNYLKDNEYSTSLWDSFFLDYIELRRTIRIGNVLGEEKSDIYADLLRLKSGFEEIFILDSRFIYVSEGDESLLYDRYIYKDLGVNLFDSYRSGNFLDTPHRGIVLFDSENLFSADNYMYLLILENL